MQPIVVVVCSSNSCSRLVVVVVVAVVMCSCCIQAKHDEILRYNSLLAGLQSRLEVAQSAVLKYESKLSRRQTEDVNRMLILARITM